MDEIEDNLTELTTIQERERYVYSLLVPFKKLSEIYNANEFIKQTEKDIKSNQETLNSISQRENEGFESEADFSCIRDKVLNSTLNYWKKSTTLLTK